MPLTSKHIKKEAENLVNVCLSQISETSNFQAVLKSCSKSTVGSILFEFVDLHRRRAPYADVVALFKLKRNKQIPISE